MKDFYKEVGEYADNLFQFVKQHELPAEWFKKPDHLAIKCKDSDDYEVTINFTELLSYSRSYVEMDGRRLAAVQLAAPISVATFGSVSWLEVMEPRPEKVGKDFVGVEHAEFVFSRFPVVEATLKEKGLDYKLQENPGHKWVNIPLGDTGRELKINDKPLAEIVSEELAHGEAHRL